MSFSHVFQERLLSHDELRQWLDELSLKLFGVPAARFAAEYEHGTFDRHDMAHQFANLIPFMKPTT